MVLEAFRKLLCLSSSNYDNFIGNDDWLLLYDLYYGQCQWAILMVTLRNVENRSEGMIIKSIVGLCVCVVWCGVCGYVCMHDV